MLERRGIPRGLAVAIVQLGALAVLLVVGYIVLPPLIDELAGVRRPGADVRRPLPGAAPRLRASIRASYPELGSFDSEVAKLADRFGGIVGSG